MRKSLDQTNENPTDNQLFIKVAELIDLARKKVATAVNLTMVHTYYEIGKSIIETEQQGNQRAQYGKTVLKDLSKQLIQKFGKGFSEQNLRNMRQFFLVFSESSQPIRQRPSGELQINNIQSDKTWENTVPKSPDFTLSWSHYIVLMRIENPAERNFYEIEAMQQNWSEAQLKRQ